MNQRGELDDLASVDLALDSLSRNERPVGAELGRGINQAAEADIDLLGISGPMLELLEDQAILPSWLHIASELILGQSWVSMNENPDSVPSPSTGPIHSLLPVIEEVASIDLDGSIDLMGRLSEALQGDIVLDGFCSLIRLEQTQDTDLQALQASVLPHLGEALEKTQDPSNDHWNEASGNSFRDLMESLVLAQDGDPGSPLQQIEPHVESMLSSTALQYQLEDALLYAHEQDHLSPLLGQLKHLASIDATGGSLSDQEDSAWAAILRLVARGNTEVSCSIDLLLIEIEVDLGNLSVEILRALAQRNPDDASSGIALLGSILGTTLTQASLDAIAISGLCPVLDTQMVEDLAAIDRLDDDDVGDLLIVMTRVLAALHDAGNNDDLIEDFVEILTILHEGNVTESSQELLRDIGDTEFATDLGAITGLLLDTSSLDAGECPSDSQPLSFQGFWNSLSVLLDDQDEGAGLSGIQPIMEMMVQHEGSWTTFNRVTALLKDASATITTLPSLLGQTLQIETTAELLIPVSTFLSEPDITTPFLHVTETQSWTQAWQSTDGPTGGPLAYLSDLVLSGTLEALLRRTQRLINLSRNIGHDSGEQ